MNDLNTLIPIITFGGLLIAAFYHTNLYIFNNTKLLKIYCIHLWVCLILLYLDIFVFKSRVERIGEYKYNNLLFLLFVRSTAFWLSFYLYIKILIIVSEYEIKKNRIVYYLVKYFFIFMVFYVTWFFPDLFFEKENYYIFHILGAITNFSAVGICIYFLSVLYKHYIQVHKYAENSYNNFIYLGSISLLFFNFFTAIAVYQNGLVFGLSYLSFNSLGYFFEIYFFSMAISFKMKTDTTRELWTLKKVNDQEIQLKNEKKKVADIIYNQDMILEYEKNKAINLQKNIIGKKLNDDISGSMVAIKYLINDYKNAANNTLEMNKFNNLETEIELIYNETQNFSHILSTHTETDHNFNIEVYLQKLCSQFNELELHKINYTIDAIQLAKLTTQQNNCLYYCLKECFSNSLKHAHAKNIWINISLENNQCKFYFKDDGKGMSYYSKKGIGASNIDNNVQLLGGKLDVKSSAEGTLVKISFNY